MQILNLILKKEQYLKNKCNKLNCKIFNIKGGIIYTKKTAPQTSQVCEMINQPECKHMNFRFIFDDNLNFDIWFHCLKKKYSEIDVKKIYINQHLYYQITLGKNVYNYEKNTHLIIILKNKDIQIIKSIKIAIKSVMNLNVLNTFSWLVMDNSNHLSIKFFSGFYKDF